MSEYAQVNASYAATVTTKQLLGILEKDAEAAEGQSLYELVALIDGVFNVDYCGHFGKFIYYTVYTEHDNDDTHKRVRQAIEEYYSE